MPENIKCRIYCERGKTINHIISECSKLAQKECKTRHDLVGKVIHWELCKEYRFDLTNKWYMQNKEYVLENETHKLQWNFSVETDHLISPRPPNRTIINKNRNCRIVDFIVPADH